MNAYGPFGKAVACIIGSATQLPQELSIPLHNCQTFVISRIFGFIAQVDGAYSALAVLSERFCADDTSSVAMGDLVALDPHKFLFCSFEAGCLLVWDRQTLAHAYHANPNLTMLAARP